MDGDSYRECETALRTEIDAAYEDLSNKKFAQSKEKLVKIKELYENLIKQDLSPTQRNQFLPKLAVSVANVEKFVTLQKKRK